MERYRRYSVYYTPPMGPFADFGASWLGWDPVARAPVDQPDLPGLDLAALTGAPRKYGFHATLKAPFRLAEGATPEALHAQVGRLAAGLGPVTLPGLQLCRIGPFLALTPKGNSVPLENLAGQVVRVLDFLRAPLTEAERARRQPDRLSARQRTYLKEWGYPYVFEEFRFHMTLSDSLSDADCAALEQALQPRLAVLPQPFRLEAISLMGEGEDERFHLISRFPLGMATD